MYSQETSLGQDEHTLTQLDNVLNEEENAKGLLEANKIPLCEEIISQFGNSQGKTTHQPSLTTLSTSSSASFAFEYIHILTTHLEWIFEDSNSNLVHIGKDGVINYLSISLASE